MYKTWAEYEADVELVWTNAMAFNEDGSQVYEDAKILKVPPPPETRINTRLHLRNHSKKRKLHSENLPTLYPPLSSDPN